MTARIAALAAALILLGGCSWFDDLFGEEDEDLLPGERISVLVLQRALEADPALAERPVALPAPTVGGEWPVPWGTPTHAPQRPAAAETFGLQWRRGAGAGESGENAILSGPAIAAGRAYAMDAESKVAAVDLQTGARAWTVDLLRSGENEDLSLGGGVAFADGILFAATPFGDVAAIDADTGAVVWRRTVSSVFRAAPAVAGGRVFAVGADNRLFAFDAAAGEQLWTHEGIAEPAGLLGAAVPAVRGELVVAAYSSGEVFALRVENGRVAWSDSLILQGRLGARASLADIDASPVIDGDTVFAVSQGGSFAAIDLRSGGRLWDEEIPSAQTPWLAGDYLFAVTVDAELVCIRRADGRIRWVSAMPRYEDPDDREDPIQWTGPVLAGDRLIVAGSHGEIRMFSPYDGAPAGTAALPGGTRAAPAIAGGTVYFLTRDAELAAFR